jgi:hypothetical protein
MPGTDDEFAEFETDEATIDRMMVEGEPAEIVAARQDLAVPTSEPSATYVVTVAPPAFLSISRPVTSTTSSGRPLRRGCARLRAHYGVDHSRSSREAVAS